MKVVIDPGHYENCLNIGPGGYNEGNAMWKLAHYLGDDLARHGIQVVYTKQTNKENPSLTARGLAARGADLFLSQHSNAGGGKGTEVFYSVLRPQDKQYAINMAFVTAQAIGTIVRGAKTKAGTKNPNLDYYSVLMNAIKAGVKHALLIENGFHDNPAEVAYLLKDENLKTIAKAQAQMTCQFLGIKYVF